MSRLEHPILDAESRGNAAFTSDSEQPRRASPLGDARTSDNNSLCRADLSINKLGDMSIDHIIGNGKGLACAYRTGRPNDKQWSDLYATLQLSEGR